MAHLGPKISRAECQKSTESLGTQLLQSPRNICFPIYKTYTYKYVHMYIYIYIYIYTYYMNYRLFWGDEDPKKEHQRWCSGRRRWLPQRLRSWRLTTSDAQVGAQQWVGFLGDFIDLLIHCYSGNSCFFKGDFRGFDGISWNVWWLPSGFMECIAMENGRLWFVKHL